MADFCPSKVLTNKNEVSSMTAQFYFIKRSGSVACVHVDVVVDDEDEDEDEDWYEDDNLANEDQGSFWWKCLIYIVAWSPSFLPHPTNQILQFESNLWMWHMGQGTGTGVRTERRCTTMVWKSCSTLGSLRIKKP